MSNLKSIFLSVVLCISMIFVGCSKEQVNTTDTLSNEKYSEELKSITKFIFEDKNYKGKDEVEVFTKDMNLKAKEDKNNQWYYNDQSYLLSIKNMYLDLHSKLSELTCSDEVTASMHNSILAQSKDLTDVTSTLLQEYSNNTDPQSLNTSIPNIKLIFTDNPNGYTVSELVRNEVNGRIKRINTSIEGITNKKVLDVSKWALNSSDDNTNTQEEVKKVENLQDDIEKARKLVLEATGENETNVIVEYLANPGSYVDSKKYYTFSMSARDGSFVSDVNYLVDKNTFEVYTCSPYGDINKIKNTESKSESSSNQEGYKCLQYSDCTIDYIHGHYEGPDGEDIEGNRAYGVCGDCGYGVVPGEEHTCNAN